MSVIVSNSSPLIALERIGKQDLLEQVFGSIIIPVAVEKEVFLINPPSWIITQAITQPLSSLMLSPTLGAGESETICLAVELKARVVLLDDRPARRTAQALGLNVIGTLGVLLNAKRQNHIPEIRSLLDALQEQDFRIAPKIYERQESRRQSPELYAKLEAFKQAQKQIKN